MRKVSSKVRFAKLYNSKNALTAADILNDQVVPWFESQNIPILRILTDRGKKYCGKLETHEYELFLAIENIDHSKTKAKHPQTNGICKRFHQTVKNEFYSIAFRKKVYNKIEELRNDLEEWLQVYNNERVHSGKYCFGKTPDANFSRVETNGFGKDSG